MTALRLPSFRLLALGLVAPALLSGCGQGTAGQTVTGTVTQKNGKPLPGGRIDLRGPSGSTFSGPINGDGRYEVPNVPPGEYAVAVDNAYLRGAGGKGPAGLDPMPTDNSGQRYVPLDPRFARPDTSGLKVTVGGAGNGSGGQPLDIPLK